jgi:hypothetical protein
MVAANERFAKISRSEGFTFCGHLFDPTKDFFFDVWIECRMASAAFRRFQTVSERLLDAVIWTVKCASQLTERN